MMKNSFESLVRRPKTAFKRLRKMRCRNGRVFCTACGSLKTRRKTDARYRCRRCGYDFALFTGTPWGRLRLPFLQTLWLVKLFELEVSARQAAAQAGVSYPTAWRAFGIFRRALLAREAPAYFTGEVELDESYFGGRRKGRRGRGAAGKIPVFGILERRGRVEVRVLPDVKAASLLDQTLKMVKRGALVYTDKFRSYDALAFCGYRHLKVDHARRFARGPVHINGLEGFWSYAKTRLLKHHGVAPEYFPEYLFEMAYRYNHRAEDLFELLLRALAQPEKSGLRAD